MPRAPLPVLKRLKRLFWLPVLTAAVGVLPACGGGGLSAPPPGSAVGSDGATLPAPTLTATTIKRLDITWPAHPEATLIRVLLDPDGDGVEPESALVELPGAATGHAQEIFLPDALAARYRIEVCNGAACEVSASARLAGNLAQAVGYVKSTAVEQFATFGNALALSRDGQTLAVGAMGAEVGTGEVTVYVRTGLGQWMVQQVLRAPNAGAGDQFGTSVALSATGDVLVVSAFNEAGSAQSDGGANDNDAAPSAGAVYVFERAQGTWAFGAYLKAPAAEAGQMFGTLVDLSDDGNTLIATSTQAPGSFARVVQVFARDAGPWTWQASLAPPGMAAADLFGASISLSGDGRRLAVGDPRDDADAQGVFATPVTNEDGPDSGAVHVYARGVAGWAVDAFLKSGYSHPGALFGSAVDLSFDGSLLLVGAKSDRTDTQGNLSLDLADSGAAYLFDRSAGVWAQAEHFKANPPVVGDLFGEAVALAGEGLALAVGAPSDNGGDHGVGNPVRTGDESDNGAVQVHQRRAGGWGAGTRVKASHIDARSNLLFGSAVALSDNGRTLAVGAPGQSDATVGIGTNPTDYSGGARSSGAAYLY